MGENRDRDSASARAQQTATREIRKQVINVPTPTQDQQTYLEQIKRSTGQYDPNVIVGGPRRPLK
jgi:hypothetical protein